jgi:hypothetical protein
MPKVVSVEQVVIIHENEDITAAFGEASESCLGEAEFVFTYMATMNMPIKR